MAVRIDRVITGGGDGGETSLGDGTRVHKDHPRVEACGAVDEANAVLGLVRLHCTTNLPVQGVLMQAQNDLFDIGADLCVPGEQGAHLRVGPGIAAHYTQCAQVFNDSLAPLDSFVLPGGSPGATYAHLARTVVRRAERAVVRLSATEPVNPELVRALNRLSDLLFVISRRLNENGARDVLWKPGGRVV